MGVISMARQEGPVARPSESRSSAFRRFAVQYLISPFLVAAIGFYFNMRLQDARAELERSRQELQRIEVAYRIIQNALSSDYEQCFITMRLVKVVLEPELADQVIDGVTEYLGRKAGRDLAEGRPEEAVAIVKAAAVTGGDASRKVDEGILRAMLAPGIPDRLTRAQQAESCATQGFRYLAVGRYEDAIEDFRKAEQAYPGYGHVSEIVKLLNGNLADMDDPDTQRQVLSEIADRFSWRSQETYVDEIRQQLLQLNPFKPRATTPESP
jgi:tetratricopeptide (TPR) repeat protein